MSSSPPARAGEALVSVIVSCSDSFPFDRGSVAALLRHTRPPWELIAIDDGSTDATYLQGVRDAAPVPVTVISDPEDRGRCAAWDRGLAAARGDYLVLLSSDVVVTDGWLDQLIALAESDPRIGMTGPMSNHAPPPQLVVGVPYRNLEDMHAFAAWWRDGRHGQWFACETISDFCLLLKRRVLEAVGGPGDRPGPGLPVGDLTLGARRAGFTLAVAHDLFVHRSGGRGFSPVPAGPRPRVSLTMIVRDEEDNLPICLESVAGLFDEVVIVDTGSTDRTKEIARGRGARIFDFVWVDDFAAARNAALARATGDYAFWIDADDVIDPPERVKLRALLDGLRAGDEAAYVVRCACDPQPGDVGATVVDHVRLFPAREDVRWTYAVHEQILPALRRAGLPARWTDVVVRHTGYVDPGVRRRKLDRDEAILKVELGDRPGDPFVLFNLGSIAVERRDWSAALDRLRASLAGSAPDDSITRKLFALIARCHQSLDDPVAALAACAEGLEIDPDDAELLFRAAVLHRHVGDSEGAEGRWRRILTLRRPERFASVDMGIYGHLTRRNLAVLAEERGENAAAARLWEEVLAECPGDPDAAGALGRLGTGAATPGARAKSGGGPS